MSPTEYHHWRYRTIALAHDVAVLTDTLAMATAYRSPATVEDISRHQADLDTANYLLAEANYHVGLACVASPPPPGSASSAEPA